MFQKQSRITCCLNSVSRNTLIHAGILFCGGLPLLLIGAMLGYALWHSRLIAPSPTFYIVDKNGHYLADIGGTDESDLGYWHTGELPERVVAATLAIEDKRFWRHPGVDLFSILRALWQNNKHQKRISGASTIAMQVARMQNPGKRTYVRKCSEMLVANFITQFYGRAKVLEHYLRIAPYGNRVRGIAYAARRYFNKPVADLSWAEIAFLTALPQAPGRMNPYTYKGKLAAIRRGTLILKALRKNGSLSHTEYQLALTQLSVISIPQREERSENALHALFQIEQLLAQPQNEVIKEQQPLLNATLDLHLQEEVAWKLRNTLSFFTPRGAGNAAAVVIERNTNAIRAYVGSSGYFDDKRAGAIDYAQLLRSSGSTLKPFIYALALEKGIIQPNTILDDIVPGAGTITNADERFLGPLLPRVALANSRNVPAANLLATIGTNEGYRFLQELELHGSSATGESYGLGLAIGGLPVTLCQLANAYSALANDGVLNELLWFKQQMRPHERRLMSCETARLISLFLSDPMARLPSFQRMGFSEYPFPVAVKTGTSSNFRDAWTVAYSSEYIVGVWLGHPNNRPMNRLSGYNSAAKLAQQIMNVLHNDQIDGMKSTSFQPPSGYHSVRLCALSGQKATPACPQMFLEWLSPAAPQPDLCSTHVTLAVDARNGLLATTQTPQQFIEIRSFVDLPPRFADWAQKNGLKRPPADPSPLDIDGKVELLTSTGSVIAHTPQTPAQATEESRHTLSIISPHNNAAIIRDPETPESLSSIPLKALVEPPVEQVVWYVNGAPFETVSYPYSTRWQLQSGTFTFQIAVPYSDVKSPPVKVLVQ